MKKFVKLGFAMMIAMAFAFVGCKHSTSEPEPEPETNPGIEGSCVFIRGRNITIRPTLWACDHEVTQAEYKTYCTYGSSSPTDYFGKGDDYPAYDVSWYDCLVYCNKRSIDEGLTPCYTINGKINPTEWGAVPTTMNETWDAVTCNFDANGYRLPTIAEWEYLARGGNLTNSGQTMYSGSNTIGEVAWYYSNSGNKTHEVKKKAPNALGLYDMSGNVEEWCWDWYGDITADTPSVGPLSGEYRIRRGGCYSSDSNFCRLNSYFSMHPNSWADSTGFRVVRSTQE